MQLETIRIIEETRPTRPATISHIGILLFIGHFSMYASPIISEENGMLITIMNTMKSRAIKNK